MRKFSRRDALTAAGAAAVAATVPALPAAAGDPDAELLARVAAFHAALVESNRALDASRRRGFEVEAMPDCPPFQWQPRAAYERWNAFMVLHGAVRLAREANAANERCGAAAQAVFAVPARTLRGALAKLRIARLATGYGDGNGADKDLDAFQDYDAPWVDAAIADLERLAAREGGRS